MNKRLIWVFAFALVVSGLASLVVYRLVSYRLVSAATKAQTRLLVASHDLAVGSLVKTLDIKEVDWYGKPPGTAITDPKRIVNRGVISTIYEGEPLQDSHLAVEGAGAGLAATIPEHLRAVAVRVNDVVSLGGFVTPGMKVDVVVMGSPPGNNNIQGHLSRTVLQNIQVLSAGQQIQHDAEGKPIQVQVVSLLVTPEQAEILSLASSHANIQFVLRNPLDSEEVKTPGTAMAKLLGSNLPAQPPPRPVAPAPPKAKPVVAAKPEPPAPVVAPPPQPIVVELIHGSKKTQSAFKDESKPEPAKPEPQRTEEKNPQEK